MVSLLKVAYLDVGTMSSVLVLESEAVDGTLLDPTDDALVDAIEGTLRAGVGGKGLVLRSSPECLLSFFCRGPLGAAISMPLRDEDEELSRRRIGRTCGESRDISAECKQSGLRSNEMYETKGRREWIEGDSSLR